MQKLIPDTGIICTWENCPGFFFFFFTFKPDLAVGMWQGKFSTIQTPCFGEVAASFLDDEIYLFYAFNLFILLPKINCHLTGH